MNSIRSIVIFIAVFCLVIISQVEGGHYHCHPKVVVKKVHVPVPYPVVKKVPVIKKVPVPVKVPVVVKHHKHHYHHHDDHHDDHY